MWITVALTGMVLVFCEEMRVEQSAAANGAAALQADAIARGAIAYAEAHIALTPGLVPTLTDMPCEAVRVNGGYFWILSHDLTNDRNSTFGLTDECSKLSVNTATADMISLLPNITPEVGAAIVDWRDSDDTPGTGGAESQYYLLQNPAYNAKNDRFESVDELGLVRDITPAVLMGEDANRNGVLDPNEDDGDQSDPPDNRNGQLDRGLLDYVTAWSRDTGKSLSGQNRIDVNSANTTALANLLQGSLSGSRLSSVVSLAHSNRPFANVLDFYFRTGMSADEFRPVADRLTAGRPKTEGLINVATAPLAVLMCIPGMDQTTAQSLISRRTGITDPSDMTWVVQALNSTSAALVGSYITTRTFVISADIVATDEHGRAFRRYWVVIDNRGTAPQVIYFKDLTGLGWPLDPQIRRDLRMGKIVVPTSQNNLAGGLH